MASTYLTRNMATQGSSIYGTFSCWFKLSNDNLTGGFLGHYFSNSYNFDICMQLGHIEVADYRTAYILRKRTTAKYRDLNAWYHLYVAIDRSLATAADRCKIYVNGERITDFQSSEDQDYSQQTSGGHSGAVSMNNDYTARVGIRYGNSDFFDGSISYMHWVDGSVIDIAQFGSTDATTGEWKINTNSTVADYGTNGFFILKDGNTITDQSSGGSYDFSLGGGTLTKTEDCPSNVFATLNPLDKAYTGTIILDNGNNTVMASSGAGDYGLRSTLAATTGKYYWEAKIGTFNTICILPMETRLVINLSDGSPADDLYGVQRYSDTQTNVYNDGTFDQHNTAMWGGITSSDVISFALDLDNGKLFLAKNGAYKNTSGATGDPVNGTNPTFTISDTTKTYGFYTELRGNGDNGTIMNFGNGYFGTTAVASAGTNASNNGIFEYDVPTGYTALSTKGLNS